MARIRTIKPDAFLSESLSEVPRGARWTFAGLWTYVDDDGRGRADVRLIKAALYPLDEATTTEDVVADLDALEAAGCICRYKVAGRAYLHIPAWSEHQKINRPTASKLPECGCESIRISEHSVSPHGSLSEPSPTEGKGREKEVEQGKEKEASSRESDEDEFASFWAAFPRKVSKGHARKAWKAAKQKTEPRVLVDAAASFAQSVGNTEPKFIPYPATWLNGERWADEAPAAADPEVSWMRRPRAKS